MLIVTGSQGKIYCTFYLMKFSFQCKMIALELRYYPEKSNNVNIMLQYFEKSSRQQFANWENNFL